ncbi:MAG: serine hydrolase [Saprospiraceae bacterium]|nr:serine hydrolase [Saprospiraceae bacterium]
MISLLNLAANKPNHFKKIIHSILWSLFILLFPAHHVFTQDLYFPPLTGNQWETVSPESLNWCAHEIPALFDYLNAEESKAFVVLKDGKIVIEKYFDQFSRDSLWYWASAGKTLTAFLCGMAQQDGILKISDPSSKYLGQAWTQCNPAQENAIRIWNQLSMTSGLDDGVPDNHCTQAPCLLYKADAGNRWAYHNAPYTLLRDVLESASGQNENSYTQSKLKSRTGMKGLWFTSGFDNVYLSDARSMARFGLLILNRGIWNQDTLLKNREYYEEMVKPSQTLNPAYGYLWWLNGQKSFKLPGLQIDFPGYLVPDAPKDMFAGIGKNGQILCVVPSENLIVMRMGESNGGDEVSILLIREMWTLLNKIRCNIPVRSTEINIKNREISAFPNPFQSQVSLKGIENGTEIWIYDFLGRLINKNIYFNNILLNDYKQGIYYIKIKGINYTIPVWKL